MANEWQSMLQSAPNLANINLVKNFQDSYGTAQEQKKTAYDQFRLQKAQDITSKARRADGTMDWDAMFKMGSEAGIGLDAFNQVHKMQQDRRASEVATQQNKMLLESMGYNPGDWDPSARPAGVIPAGGTAYEGANPNDYAFLTQGTSETQKAQVPDQTFVPQGVGETTQTSGAPSAPAQPAPQDVVGANEVLVAGQTAPTSKASMYQLPMPELREPAQDSQGYYNELWRAQRDPEAVARMFGGAGATGAGDATLSVDRMKPEELANLSRYAALRGIQAKDPQSALTTLENMAVGAVAKPVLNPMIGMMPKDKMAEEYGRYNQAVAEYPAKLQEARNKLSEAIRTGNYEVLDKQIAVAGNERATEQNKRAREQVEWPEVFSKPFESPTEKANARQASSASRGISDAIAELGTGKDAVTANDPRFPAIRMAVAKDIMIAYGLPVTEGVMQELEGLVRSGTSVAEIGTAMQEHGIVGGAANAMGQLATQIFGLKDPNTIKEMGKSAQTFANRKYKNLGVSDEKAFNAAFPITRWQDEKPSNVLPEKPQVPKPSTSSKKNRSL